jgi:hypothetical protein
VRGSAFALVHLLKATGAVDPLYNPDPALHFPMVDALASEPHFVYATRMARVLGKAYAPRLDPAIELASWAGGDAEGAKASPAPSGVIDAISALFARADLDTDSNEAFQAAMALLRAGVLSDASAPLIIDAALGRRGTNVRAEIMARLPLAKGERTIAALRSIAEQADRITRPAARAALLRLGAEDPFAEDGAITKEQLSALALRDLGHLVHKLKAKDTTGRWAYYFVLVQATREEAFLAAIKDKGTIDLEDYGKVVASCYGEQPTQEIKDYLSERYGWNV